MRAISSIRYLAERGRGGGGVLIINGDVLGWRRPSKIFARGAALSRLLGLLSTLAGAGVCSPHLMLLDKVINHVVGMAQIGLGFPFAVRAALLGCTFVAAAQMMHDIGFTPTPLTTQ